MCSIGYISSQLHCDNIGKRLSQLNPFPFNPRLWGLWAYEGQLPYFCLIINVTGSLPSNLRPSYLKISQNLSAPGWNGWTQEIDGFYLRASPSARSNLSLCSDRPYHSPGFHGNGSWNCILLFRNGLPNNVHALYNFSFCSSYFFGCLDFPNSNVTYYTYITAEIMGLSKPVVSTEEFALRDVQTQWK